MPDANQIKLLKFVFSFGFQSEGPVSKENNPNTVPQIEAAVFKY